MRNAKKYPTQYKEKKETDEFPYKLGEGKTFLTMTQNPEYEKILKNFIT